MKRKKSIINSVSVLLITIAVVILFSFNQSSTYGIKAVSYNEFQEMIKNNIIDSVSINFSEDTFSFEDKDGLKYETDNPKYDDFKKDLLESNVNVKVKSSMNYSSIISIVLNLFIFSIIGYSLYSMVNSQGLKSKNNLIIPENNEKELEEVDTNGNKVLKKRNTSFEDVAGLKQVKKDMMSIVDFMKNPKKYNDVGAKLPKGVILNGPPGTGKTLLARAIAGEAGVPFFSMSGSDFVELYVGMGARRVRNLFEEARKKAPCIVFIDEIDAIGKKRDSHSGNDERMQTLNALLTEMDGFTGREGILIISATNRPEDLDKALVRPGRFDKHIYVPLPETPEERLEVLKLYSHNKKFAENVNFESLAKETIGFSPADIESLLNEAAIISVQKNKRFIDRECIDNAVYMKLLKGHAKDDINRNKEEIELVAWHEAGHAVIGKVCDMDVSKVTIVQSTSGAGGVNIIIPKKMGLYSIKELEDNVKMSYGGKCAEYLLYGDWNKTTTGASSDIQQATATIYQMISLYGMTEEYAMLNLNELHIDNKVILDKAIEISNRLKNEALEILKEHHGMLEEIVSVLLEKETISGEELDVIYKKHVTDVQELNSNVEYVE